MARISTTKAYDNKDVIIQINDLKDAVADLGQGIVIATEMPTAVAAYLDKVYLYIGDTDGTYRENNIYKCIETSGVYSWSIMNVSTGISVAWGDITGTLSGQADLQAALDAKQATALNETGTLTVAGWSSNSQTVSITGVTASNIVIVSYSADTISAAQNAELICTAQASGTLTFTCTTTPTVAITFNAVIL